VRLARSKAGLGLFIKDNGGGFDVEQARGKGGLGLISMEERVRIVNGEFKIRSEAGWEPTSRSICLCPSWRPGSGQFLHDSRTATCTLFVRYEQNRVATLSVWIGDDDCSATSDRDATNASDIRCVAYKKSVPESPV